MKKIKRKLYSIYKKAVGFLVKALPYPIKYCEDLKNMPKIGDKKIIEIMQTCKLAKKKMLPFVNQVEFLVLDQQVLLPSILKQLKLLGIRKRIEICQIEINKFVCIQWKIQNKGFEEKKLPQYIRLFKKKSMNYVEYKDYIRQLYIDLIEEKKKHLERWIFQLQGVMRGNLLNHHLKMPNRTHHDCKTYMDIEKVSNQAMLRRIDIQNCIQKNSMVVQFCTSLHEIVGSKNGYILSDYELYPNQKDAYKKKLWKGEVTLCKEEMDVYKILGLLYKPTKERSV
ncbi:unnamed protein product [Paramecium pentaurelia]|uniref:DNA polymerase beta thumb domain-containing protein n=1 Tax=Paramecium pentaurelia TaxID=43138 RepID=A0A8S1UB45_9CILI|nr:unnamed protein product [Paramecium pentaurelia]